MSQLLECLEEIFEYLDNDKIALYLCLLPYKKSSYVFYTERYVLYTDRYI